MVPFVKSSLVVNSSKFLSSFVVDVVTVVAVDESNKQIDSRHNKADILEQGFQFFSRAL